MRFTRIQAQNLKGRTFDHQLGDLNIITGENDTGKTSIADACRLVLLGYLPERGKTNPKTFELSSGSKMAVCGEFSSIGPVAREWVKKGKSVTASATGAEALPETPLVMLDANEYFACKSDKARVDMLFSVLRLDPEKFDRAAVRQSIREACADSLVEDFEKLISAGTEDPDSTMDAWLAAVAAEVATAATLANQEAKRFEGTAQGIIQLRMDAPTVDPAAIASAITASETNLAKLRVELGKLQQAETTSQETAKKRQAIIEKIATLAALVSEGPIEDEEASKDALELCIARISTLRAEHDASVKAYEANAKNKARALFLQGRIATIKAKPRPIAGEVATIEAELAQLAPADVTAASAVAFAARATVATLAEQSQANSQAKEILAAEYNAAVSKPCCPVCGAEGQEFKKFLRVRLDTRLAAIEAERLKIAAEFAAATEQSQAATEAHNAAVKRDVQTTNLRELLGVARQHARQFEHDAEMVAQCEAELAKLGDPTAEPPAEPAELNELLRNQETLRASIRRAAAAKSKAESEAELASMPPTAEEIGEDVYRTECEIAATLERLEELKAQEQQAQNQKADDQRLAQAQEGSEKAAARDKALKAMGKALVAERERMINAVFTPLLETVNQFTAGILTTPLEFHDGELGRFNKGSWVPVSAFGGCFQAVTYAGIQAALGAGAPSRLVIVDELRRMDAKRKHRFLGNVAAAIKAGIIHQFIGIDPDASGYGELDGITHIAVG